MKIAFDAVVDIVRSINKHEQNYFRRIFGYQLTIGLLNFV